MDSEVALYFRDEFREARAAALEDAEGYQQILFVLERFGSYLFEGGCREGHEHSKDPKGLGVYRKCIKALVKKAHPLEKHRKKQVKWISLYRETHTAFDNLYEMVMHGRNDALHQGAFARILTLHLVEIALVLEDALMAMMGRQIKDYMIQNPVCASDWQPVSFVRQMMLANSFSYIPVRMEKQCAGEKSWHIVADYHIAAYLLWTNSNCREKLLAKPIRDAIGSNRMAIEKAFTAHPDEKVQAVLERYALKPCYGKPILVVKRDNCDELLGIATAHDLM